jgi:hypothetical protein
MVVPLADLDLSPDFAPPFVHSGKDFAFSILPPLPPVQSPLFPTQFLVKLRQCSIRCHFRDNDAGSSVKALMTNDLSDILRVIESPSDSFRLTGQQVAAVLSMVSANLVRAVPLISDECLSIDNASSTFFDPEWSHLHLVYQILIRLLSPVPSVPEISLSFIRTVLGQAGSPDRRELVFISRVVQRFVQHPQERLSRIWPMLESVLSVWSDTTNFPFAAGCVLAVTADLLNEFGLAGFSLQFFKRSILPLASCMNFNIFRVSYTMVVTEVAKFIPAMAPTILAVMLRHWPNFNVVKQMAFLKVIAFVLPPGPKCLFASLLPAAVDLVARCISGPTQKPAERALELVLGGTLDFLLQQKDRVFFTNIYSAVLTASRRHWDADIRQFTTRVITYLSKIDPVTSRDLEGSGSVRAWTARDDPKTHSWTVIARTAARNNTGLRLGTKLAEILKTFDASRPMSVDEVTPGRRWSLANGKRNVEVPRLSFRFPNPS